jgi:DNA-binding transcriptional ArsR family regulator
LDWIAASEGTKFSEVMSDFAAKLRALGPLGQGEGLAAGDLALRLDAANQLVPYIKLVERQKLRIPHKSEAAYAAFYESDAAHRMFGELVAERLTMSQILLLLAGGPLATGEISARTGLSPSEVSRHMISASRQGLVRYDTELKRYARA